MLRCSCHRTRLDGKTFSQNRRITDRARQRGDDARAGFAIAIQGAGRVAARAFQNPVERGRDRRGPGCCMDRIRSAGTTGLTRPDIDNR